MKENAKKKLSEKRERFVRIAEKRVNKILDDLDSLSKCSHKNNYEYYNTDVNKIFNEIERKAKETKLRFQDTTNNKKRFTLE